MALALGTRVLVKRICLDVYEKATVAGHYERERDQLDATGRFVIAPRGIVYQVRYSEDGGIYNAHESSVFAE